MTNVNSVRARRIVLANCNKCHKVVRNVIKLQEIEIPVVVF